VELSPSRLWGEGQGEGDSTLSLFESESGRSGSPDELAINRSGGSTVKGRVRHPRCVLDAQES
jgi:hypothetical protein